MDLGFGWGNHVGALPVIWSLVIDQLFERLSVGGLTCLGSLGIEYTEKVEDRGTK